MFKCFRQLEHSDCGLTCIRMVARHYGADIPLRYLHVISDLNRLGMSIRDITSCCSKIGLESAAVRVGEEQLADMPLPAILYWQQCHFVVLYKYSPKKNRFFIADPAQGKTVYNKEDFLRYWILHSYPKAIMVGPETSPFHIHLYFYNLKLDDYESLMK